MAASDTDSAPQATIAWRPKRGLLGGISPSSRFYWFRILAENRVALASGIFLLLVVILALLAPIIAPHDPYVADPIHRLEGPSSTNWFGTDDLGRDILSRMLYGARISLLVGVSVMLAAAFFGSLIGLLAGYYDRIDTPIMRVMDGLMAFPSILFAIAIMASLGPRTINVIIALVIVDTPRLARLVRSLTLSIREMVYVESARAIGASASTILRRYIFLNALSPVIVQCAFIVAFAILAEAGLSFLGAGVPPEVPTWGNMLQVGQRLISRAWWISIFPGIALFLTILTLTLLGDGLRDALDPRMRER